MAKKNSSRSAGKEIPSDVPDGFNIKASRQQGDGWASKEEGNVITGRLLGMFTMEGDSEPRNVFQVEISQPCKGTKGSGDDAEEVTFEPGAVLNCDGAALRGLTEFVRNGNVYDMWVKYIGTRKVGRGTMADTEGPFLKLVKKADIPF